MSVRQRNPVTPNHLASWTTDGVIQDAGTPGNPALTSGFGITSNNEVSIGINNELNPGPFNQFGLGITDVSAWITVTPYNGAPQLPLNISAGGLTIIIDGVPYAFPGSYVPSSAVTTLPNIATLRASSTVSLITAACYVLGYYAGSDGGEGQFWQDFNDTTSADNGGTIIVDASGRRWYRETGGVPYSVRWFGAKGDGTTDDTTAIQATLTFGLDVTFPPGSYNVSAALIPRIGAAITAGSPGNATITQLTANASVFSLISSVVVTPPGGGTLSQLRISGLTLKGGAANVAGIRVTKISDTLFSDIQFLGCAGGAIVADRGYFHLANRCISRPSASFVAGQFQYYSSDDANYLFYPTLQDCVVDAADEFGTTLGVVFACVYFRRVIGGAILNFVGERLNVPTPNVTVGIIIENDCQGVKIFGGVTYGSSWGVLMQPGAGVAASPGYIDIDGHDVDYFTQGGIGIVGTSSAVAADITITGSILTAARSASIPYIYVSEALKVSIDGVVCDDYTASHFGVGVSIQHNGVCLVTGCIFSFLNYAFAIGAGATQIYAANNSITDCTNPINGATALYGTISRFSGNRGLGPNELNISTPAVPGSGVPIFNDRGCDVMIFLTGGTNITASVGPANLGASAGPFYVTANVSISISYTTAPTWVWVGL